MDQSVEPGTTAHQAYQYIKERVISGSFSAGMRLTEEQLAREIGASRTPIREAMRLLMSDGFLLFKPNVGTFVRSWTAEEIGEIFDLRIVLEAEITRLAGLRISDPDIERLRTIQRQLEAHGPSPSFEQLSSINKLNREFHRVIAEASQNKRLVAMLTNSIEVPIVQQTFRRYTPQQMQRSFQHHRELIDAFAARDSDWAHDVMSCHIRAARHVLLAAQDSQLSAKLDGHTE
jgi:DNA-binding GntR family transcriptional regulator